MRLDVVSKAARAAARFSAQCQSQRFRAAHASATMRAALAVEAGQAQQRSGRYARLLPVAAAVAVLGVASAADLDSSAAKCDCDCGYKDKPEEKTCYANQDKQPAGPQASTLATLNEVVAKLNRIESAVANPHRHTDGLNSGVDVVLGAQWGDEGKGKLVDSLSQSYDVILRVAGGSNAGHTIVHEGKKYKFRLVPSGILNPNAICIIGNGVVVHLPSLLQELDELKQMGVDYEGR
ncbi:Adenylosuccinate synthetase, partial [Phytophthora rubi]